MANPTHTREFLTASLRPGQLARFTALAKALGVTRSALARSMVEVTLARYCRDLGVSSPTDPLAPLEARLDD